jgi:hypothetical protein
MDSDGDLDVVASASQANRVSWYENDGSENFTELLVGSFSGARAVHVADLNEDDRPDVASVSLSLDSVVWFENLGGGSYLSHQIDNDLDLGFGLYIADVDRDTDLDILATGGLANDVVWYESDLADPQQAPPWPDAIGVALRIFPTVARDGALVTCALPVGGRASVEIYDLEGGLVRTLVRGYREPGHFSVMWDRRDGHGRTVPDGVYFCRLVAGDIVATRKLVLTD